MNVRSIGLQGLGLVGRKGLIALSFLLVARAMGPELFGRYSYAFTCAYVFFALSSLGLSPVTTREIVRSPADAARLLRASMLVRVCCAGMGVLVLLAIDLWPGISGRPGVAGDISLFALMIPAYAVLDQLGAYVMGFGQNAKFAAINLIQWGSFAVATGLGLLLWPTIERVISSQVTGMWIGLVFVFFYLGRPVKEAWRTRPGLQLGWRLLKEALPLAITTVLGILYFRVGTLLLFRYAGAHETGLFTSSLQVIEALQLIPMAIIGAMFPVVCNCVNDRERLARQFERISSSIFFISLFLATTGTILSGTVIRLVFGTNFGSSGTLLRLLIWDVVPNFLAFTLGYFLIAMKKQVFLTVSGAAGVVVSVGLNRLLIPIHGAMGAVYSSLFTETSICAVCLIFVMRYIQIGPPVRLGATAAVGALVVWALGTVWKTEINSTLLSAVGFGAVSLALFTGSFFFYRRLATRIEVA